MRRLRRAALPLLAVLWLAAPEAAEACSVCFSTTEQNRWAFLVTTGLLSLLPLGLLGGIGVWLRRRVREMERQHEAARQVPPQRA